MYIAGYTLRCVNIHCIHRKGIQYIHDAMTGDIHMSV